MFGQMGDMMKLMGQLPKLKQNLAAAQERAKNRQAVGESGAGMVRVTANGLGEILSVKFDPEVLKDPDLAGPLVASAVNLALLKSKEVLAEEAKVAMGGMDLPPGMI